MSSLNSRLYSPIKRDKPKNYFFIIYYTGEKLIIIQLKKLTRSTGNIKKRSPETKNIINIILIK